MKNMAPLHPNQGPKAAADGRARTASNPRISVGYHQRGLHSGTTRSPWSRRGDECGRLGQQKGTFPPHEHNHHGTRSSSALPCTHLEITWTTEASRVRPRASVHLGVHSRAVPTSWHQVSSHNGLSPTGGWPDRTCQPRTGAIPSPIRQRKTGRLGQPPTNGRVSIHQSSTLGT